MLRNRQNSMVIPGRYFAFVSISARSQIRHLSSVLTLLTLSYKSRTHCHGGNPHKGDKLRSRFYSTEAA